jgi:hypothetical protein
MVVSSLDAAASIFRFIIRKFPRLRIHTHQPIGALVMRTVHHMLTRFLAASILCFASLSCSKDDQTPVVPAEPETAIGTFDSYHTGTISTPSGNAIQIVAGAVPPDQNNNAAKVTFSIESPVAAPAPIPSGATTKGDIVFFGPEGFNFRWPVRISLHYPDNANTDDLKILHFNASRSAWFVVPTSAIDVTRKVISADVLELGHYVLATVSTGTRKALAEDSEGGFKYGGEPGYYYSLTVRSVTFKYPAQAAWYNLVGVCAGSTGSTPTGGPGYPTHARLPQGSYQIWITRTLPGTLSNLPRVETYTVPVNGTINNPLRYWGMGNEEGWTNLAGVSGGEWREGRPSEWPQPTAPMGTGEFQATLTWVNTTAEITDLDLHLYGPNSMHVYWDNTSSSDGSIQLDRDWISDVGNAVENIYSVNKMPAGSYTIKVDNFGGPAKQYNVRVIRFGTVKTYSGSLSESADPIVLATFTVN